MPSLDVLVGAVDEDILGHQISELGDVLRFEDLKVATDDVGTALSGGVHGRGKPRVASGHPWLGRGRR